MIAKRAAETVTGVKWSRVRGGLSALRQKPKLFKAGEPGSLERGGLARPLPV